MAQLTVINGLIIFYHDISAILELCSQGLGQSAQAYPVGVNALLLKTFRKQKTDRRLSHRLLSWAVLFMARTCNAHVSARQFPILQ